MKKTLSILASGLILGSLLATNTSNIYNEISTYQSWTSDDLYAENNGNDHYFDLDTSQVSVSPELQEMFVSYEEVDPMLYFAFNPLEYSANTTGGENGFIFKFSYVLPDGMCSGLDNKYSLKFEIYEGTDTSGVATYEYIHRDKLARNFDGVYYGEVVFDTFIIPTADIVAGQTYTIKISGSSVDSAATTDPFIEYGTITLTMPEEGENYFYNQAYYDMYHDNDDGDETYTNPLTGEVYMMDVYSEYVTYSPEIEAALISDEYSITQSSFSITPLVYLPQTIASSATDFIYCMRMILYDENGQELEVHPVQLRAQPNAQDNAYDHLQITSTLLLIDESWYLPGESYYVEVYLSSENQVWEVSPEEWEYFGRVDFTVPEENLLVYYSTLYSEMIISGLPSENELTDVSEPVIDQTNQTAQFTLTFSDEVVLSTIEASIDGGQTWLLAEKEDISPTQYNATFSTENIDLSQEYEISWRINNVEQQTSTTYDPTPDVAPTPTPQNERRWIMIISLGVVLGLIAIAGTTGIVYSVYKTKK